LSVHGATPEEAMLEVKTLDLRFIAEKIEHGEIKPDADTSNSSSPHEPMANNEVAASPRRASTVWMAFVHKKVAARDWKGRRRDRVEPREEFSRACRPVDQVEWGSPIEHL
jgi:hypothetical protein